MSGYGNDEKKLIDEIDIVDLVSKFVDLTKSGSGYKGYSPFKDENTPSFHVHPGKKIFKDFSSNIGGNVIKFYSLMKNISYNQAIKELAKEYNIKITNSFEKNRIKNLPEHNILREVTNFFKSNLENSKEARSYLEKRGYNVEELSKFNIGYADLSWDKLFEYFKDTYSKETLLNLGLISQSNDKCFDMFRDRIMFPINNIDGQIIGFGGRSINNNKDIPKYINSKESKIFDKSKELYGLFDNGLSLNKNRYAILVEGFFDVISLHLNGFENAVASLGTAFTEKQAALLKKYVDSIVILYDSDQAGQLATKNVIKILNKFSFNIRCVNFENKYKDPDEFFRENKKEDFLEVLKNSTRAFDYIYNIEVSNLNVLNSVTARKTAIDKMREYFLSIKSLLIFDDEIKRFAKFLNIDSNILLKEYDQKLIREKKVKEKKQIVIITDEEKKYIIEKHVIEYLISDSKVDYRYKQLLKDIPIEDEFLNELNKKIEAIGYNMQRIPEIILYEDQKKFLFDIVCSIKKEDILTEINYINLYKSYLLLKIEKIVKQIENYDDFVKRIKTREKINKLKEGIKNTNLIEELRSYFDEIVLLND